MQSCALKARPRPHHRPQWTASHSYVSCIHARRLRAANTTSTSYGTEIEQLRHITKDGWGLELLLARSKLPTSRPPLLFVHGSYHAAWCWADHFLPYFAQRGYNAYAISLRAQGNSDCVRDGDGETPIAVAGTLDSHADHLADLIANLAPAPVVIGHSFGGLILQKYVLRMSSGSNGSNDQALPPVAGTAYLACVPPSGNKSMILRFLRKDLLLSLRVTWGFVAKSFVKDVGACRELFFSSDIPTDDLIRYHKQFAVGSPVRLINLSDVNKQTPLPPPPPYAPPAFVLGGEDDKVVDVEAIKELASVCGVPPIILPNMAHDVMLDTRWQQAAAELEIWLNKL